MNKRKVLFFLVIGIIAGIALFRGIILGDPADMRMEASGL